MADPLSIAASVIALATAAAQIGNVISRLRHFGKVPGRIYALKNEVSDLEAVLCQVAQALKSNSLTPVNEQGSLEHIVLRTRASLTDLGKALERIAKACEGGKLEFINKTTIWYREKTLFQGFHEDLRSVKISLNLMLSVANSRDLSHVVLQLQQVTLLTSNAAPSEDPSNRLIELTTRMNDQYQDLSVRLDVLGQLISNGQKQTLPNPDRISIPTVGSETHDFRVLASHRIPCRGWCPCACHEKQKSKLAIPELIEKFVGRMFVGYSGSLVVNKPCNFRGCRDRQKTTATVEYWFPWWFAAVNLKLQLTYLPQAGPQFQLSTTRRVPDGSESVRFAMKGDIEGLKHLFTHGLASPRDVSDSRGFTLMRWALYGGMHNYETVQFLLNEGALIDETSYDNVWDFTFRNKCSEKEKHELRCITEGGETNWVDDQNFPLVHRIVFGLSSKSLATELDENPNAVYATDAQNRTALDWATARAQLDDMKILLRRGANPNNMDITGRTPVLHAVDTHDPTCLRLILEAGGSPDPVYPKGIFRSSPLTAAGFAGLPELLKLLLLFEADPNACNPEGMTALHSVVVTPSVECALLLLEFGANLNALSSTGKTPLTTAVIHNNHPILRLFVERCYEYLTTFRFQSPQLLPTIAEYADIETMNIIASSNPLKFALDLSSESIVASKQLLHQRQDFDEELLDTFEELLAITKTEEAKSRSSVDALLESGFYLSAKSSFHSELSDAFANLKSIGTSPITSQSVVTSPVDGRFGSPLVAHFQAKYGLALLDSPIESEQGYDDFADACESLLQSGEKQ